MLNSYILNLVINVPMPPQLRTGHADCRASRAEGGGRVARNCGQINNTACSNDISAAAGAQEHELAATLD